MKKLFITGISAIIMATSALAETETGINAYSNGDYDTAFAELVAPANAGDLNAQYYFGLLYANGRGTSLSEINAWMWFIKAGNKGHTLAQYELGKIYENGIGIPADYAFAHMWHTIAAGKDHGPSKTALENLKPKMTERDFKKAALMLKIWQKKHSQ